LLSRAMASSTPAGPDGKVAGFAVRVKEPCESNDDVNKPEDTPLVKELKKRVRVNSEMEKAEEPPLIRELKEIDDKFLALEREYERALRDLNLRYGLRRKPLLQQRVEILTRQEGQRGDTGTPLLEGFWLQALKNHAFFEDVIEEWDEDVLRYLTNITADPLNEKESNSFRICFHFVENPYFTNSCLKKDYHIEEVTPYTKELLPSLIRSDEIQWKPGKDITIESVQKKRKASAKIKTKQRPRDSFFRCFFRTLQPDMDVPADIDPEQVPADEDDDEDTIDALMENDYYCGKTLAKEIVPWAVRWYTGEAVPDDEEEEDDEDEDDEADEKVLASTCSCGNAFADDALFCRKCGKKREKVKHSEHNCKQQ